MRRCRLAAGARRRDAATFGRERPRAEEDAVMWRSWPLGCRQTRDVGFTGAAACGGAHPSVGSGGAWTRPPGCGRRRHVEDGGGSVEGLTKIWFGERERVEREAQGVTHYRISTTPTFSAATKKIEYNFIFGGYSCHRKCWVIFTGPCIRVE
jgi:hypothetical protein